VAADSAIPIPVSRPAPRYPPEALRRSIGGTVRVRAVVAPDGSVERMEVAESSGNRFLDRAAMEAVRRWTFKPAVRGGQAVSAEVILPLEFNPNG
jgi:protein TonB